MGSLIEFHYTYRKRSGHLNQMVYTVEGYSGEEAINIFMDYIKKYNIDLIDWYIDQGEDFY